MTIDVKMFFPEHMSGKVFVPERYITKGYVERVLSFFTERDHNDYYGRTGFTKWLDNLTGVSEHQMEQRAGYIVHEVVPAVPEERNFVHWVEDECDKRFGWMTHELPQQPDAGYIHPKPFDYNRCW